MNELDLGSVVLTLAGVAAGSVITAAGSIAADALRERRRVRTDLREARLDRIKQTRRMLQATLDQAVSLGRGQVAAAEEAGRVATAQEDASLYLVGDDAVALAYRELLVAALDRVGLPWRVDDQVLALEVMNRVSKALGDQAELARAGKPLRELSAETVTAMSDVRALADRVPMFDVQPTVDARLARMVIRAQRWLSRHRWYVR